MKTFIVLVICEISAVIALNVYHCKNQEKTNYGEHDLYNDGIRLSGKTSIKLQIKGKHDAHILLQQNRLNEHSNIIEIVVGGWDNGKSVIRTQQQQDPAVTEHIGSGVLSASTFRWFWISWSRGCIEVGKDEIIGGSRFMRWCGRNLLFTAIRISFGFGSDGYFAFECKDIVKCAKRQCSNARDTVCTECIDNKTFYKAIQSGKKCGRMCSFDHHKCWPGRCSDELTTRCQCSPGFTRVSNSSLTSCQLAKANRPTINQCFTTISGPNKEKSQTTPGRCNAQAFYGNFQPVDLDLILQSDFKVNVTLPTPSFIHTSTFGVTDAIVYMKRMLVDGMEVEINTTKLVTDNSNGTNAKQTVYKKTQIPLLQPKYRLANGERLCIHFETLGGGFVQGKDTRTNTPLIQISYQKTTSTETVCYVYDKAEPQHCREKMSCKIAPLVVDKRVTRSKHVLINFDGWFDPVPSGGNQSSSSGIDFFEISLHEVSSGRVSEAQVFTKKEFNVSQTFMTVNITSNSPRLYCLKLGVKDKANNVKFARRFVLYDNTSLIKPRTNKTMFYVSSASETTHYLWQTHHNNICVIWKDYLYNDFYIDNPFLGRVQSHSDFVGVYEQTEGPLPINGTVNVHGIINFLFSWKLNNESFSNETVVPSFTQQSFCTNIDMKDGQTYTLNIKAKDIVNNTFAEARRVYIDRSAPFINNIWISKDDIEQLFVHDNNDLSKMKLSFETFDPHSGIRSIEWAFGTENTGHLLGKGTISVNRLKGDSCSTNESECYCPEIGGCENRKYTVDLNMLVNDNTHIGDHNRNYFLTLTVYNHAGLRNVEHLDILVDVSPPESGVVFEGSIGSSDIDYTDDDNFIVRWHGFIDHESGIKMYKIGVSENCLNKKDFMSQNDTPLALQLYEIEHPETSIRVQVNFTGKMYVTVIAINNALQYSTPACSDGIIRDIDAPKLRNITLQNAKWSSSMFCLEGQAWFFNNELIKMPLSSDLSCKIRCSNYTEDIEMFQVLPQFNDSHKETDIDEFLCKSLPLYDSKTIVYLPNDHISIKWDVDEDMSQIEDFFVGIGKSSYKNSNPTIQMYRSSNGKPFYYVNHLGLGSNEEFYIFVKVINKAKLENVISFGPLLIDETPPLYTKMPVVSIQTENVIISWEDGQFYDTEQKEKIDQIFFQFIRGTTAVSPLLEWRYADSRQCHNVSGGCFSYPLRRLQQKDTEAGETFSAETFIYNKAGHLTNLRTDPFRIPSKYPPGHGIVFDIDPSETSDVLDINAHFTEKKICAYWKGFRHHENVSLEIGIGSNTTNDDVLKFKSVSNMDPFACLISENLKYGVRYFVSIRASCTGGSTISSSNGVVIINSHTLLKKSDIQVGIKHVHMALDIDFINSSYAKYVLCHLAELVHCMKYLSNLNQVT